jgi:hypothetical protein
VAVPPAARAAVPARAVAAPPAAAPQRTFATLWEFAVALNRQEPAALAMARDGEDIRMALDGAEVRKLLGTIWFRTIFPHLSAAWRDRLLGALVEDVVIPNHLVKCGHRTKVLQTVSYEELKEVWSNTFVPEEQRADLELLLTVRRLWGEEALSRLRFAGHGPSDGPSKLGALIQSLRT